MSGKQAVFEIDETVQYDVTRVAENWRVSIPGKMLRLLTSEDPGSAIDLLCDLEQPGLIAFQPWNPQGSQLRQAVKDHSAPLTGQPYVDFVIAAQARWMTTQLRSDGRIFLNSRLAIHLSMETGDALHLSATKGCLWMQSPANWAARAKHRSILLAEVPDRSAVTGGSDE